MDLLTRALVTKRECCTLGASESGATGMPDALSTDQRVANNCTRPTALVDKTCVVKLDGVIEKAASVVKPIAINPVPSKSVLGGRLELTVISDSQPLRTDDAVIIAANGWSVKIAGVEGPTVVLNIDKSPLDVNVSSASIIDT